MANIKTAVSLPAHLFERTENLAREMKTSRSQLFALALEEYLRRRESREIIDRLNEVFAEGPDPEDEVFLDAAARHAAEVADEWK